MSDQSDIWMQAPNGALVPFAVTAGTDRLKDYQPTQRNQAAPITNLAPEVWQAPVIAERPAPVVKPVSTLDDARKLAFELQEEIEAAIPDYEQACTDTTASDRLIEIGERLALIAPEYERLTKEPAELRSRKPVDQEFVEYVVDLEKRALFVSGEFFEATANNWSQKLFSLPFNRNMGNGKGLSDGSRQDIIGGLQDLRQYCNHQIHVRFGQSAQKTIQSAKQTLARLRDSLADVLKIANAKEKK
jgi:hypothetical protein